MTAAETCVSIKSEEVRTSAVQCLDFCANSRKRPRAYFVYFGNLVGAHWVLPCAFTQILALVLLSPCLTGSRINKDTLKYARMHNKTQN